MWKYVKSLEYPVNIKKKDLNKNFMRGAMNKDLTKG